VILATVVDWKALLDVVVASLVAVVGVTIMFSLAIYGSTRFAEVRRAHHGVGVGAIGYAALAFVGLAVTGGAVALGLYEMLSK
jgi:hypothetical protein